MTRTAIDLFCGAAGGWALGLARAGVRVVTGVEIDPERARSYAARWKCPVLDDVRLLTRLDFRVRGPWLLCGSPPCQDASEINRAGKGVDGEKTRCFFDAIRLAGELRPAWLALENVSGLRTRGADRVIAAMAEVGYPARPLVVGSALAGKDHDRSRVFFVAPDATRREGWAPGQSRPASGGPSPRWIGVPGSEDRRHGLGHLRPATLGRHVRAYDGVSTRLAERARAAYGDTLDPIFPELIASALIAWEDGARAAA